MGEQAQQASGPSAATEPHDDETHLLDLPDNCLHNIVRFMDPPTREQFFRASKGSDDKPGCAVLVLRACRKASFCHRLNMCGKPVASTSSMLNLAARVSTGVQVSVDVAGHELQEALQSLLLFRAGIPATYPGVSTLMLEAYQAASLIPDVLPAAFPNLKSLHLTNWEPKCSLEPSSCIIQSQRLAGVTHLHAVIQQLDDHLTLHHISQQLAYLPAVTSMQVNQGVLLAAPGALLRQVTHLSVHGVSALDDEINAALLACTNLTSLRVHRYQADTWAPALPQAVPQLRELDLGCALTCQLIPHILALTHLTRLTLEALYDLSSDFSDAACTWRRLHFTRGCHQDIVKLPLRTLDSPVHCAQFTLKHTGAHADDMAAIMTAARHNLVRCGGIKMRTLRLQFPAGLARHQAEELMVAWEPCLVGAKDIRLRCEGSQLMVMQDCIARLWPQAKVC